MSDETLKDIARSLRVIAMVLSDKQIAHLRMKKKEKERTIKSWGDDASKELKEDISLYDFKIKTYEELLNKKV